MRLLGIDRGTRKIGLARRASNTKITFPLGYIDNDEHTIATISRFVTLYEIDTVIYGFVDNKRMRHQLDLCREQITMLHPMITWTGSNEAYTSIQADILLQSNHHPGQDSVAAMFILNNYLENIQKK